MTTEPKPPTDADSPNSGGLGESPDAATKAPSRGLITVIVDLVLAFQGRRVMNARRRRSAQMLLVGTIITCLVLLLDLADLLRPMENFFYDERCYFFQNHFPQPTDRLIHIDIDDGVLESQDRRWPWPRSMQAKVVRELNLANPKVIFLDITYQESDQTPGEDDALASAIADSGKVLSPVTLNIEVKTKRDPLETEISNLFRVNLLLSQEKIFDALPIEYKRRVVQAELSEHVIKARKQTASDLIAAVILRNPSVTRDEVVQAVLPQLSRTANNPIKSIVEHQYDIIRRIETVSRFAIPVPPDRPPLTVPNTISAPIVKIGSASATSGFVDYIPTYAGDSKVRFIPLFINIGGKAFPHVALSMVCKYNGISPDEVVIEKDRVIVPTKIPGERAIEIPIRSIKRSDGEVAGYVTDIPWFGDRRWQTMYDYPAHLEQRQHQSLLTVTNIMDSEATIANNMRATRKYLANIATSLGVDPNSIESIRKDDIPVDMADMDGALVDGKGQSVAYLNFAKRMNNLFKNSVRPRYEAALLKPTTLPATSQPLEAIDLRTNDEERGIVNAVDFPNYLERVLTQIRKAYQDRDDERAKLRLKLEDKIVLVGFTATGLVDQYPTAIHAVAPGVVAHGAMVNGMLTHHFWRRAPLYYTHLLTLGFGLLVTLLATSESPTKATIGAVGTTLGYIMLNGAVLFDRYGIVLGVAGPLTASVGAIAGVTLFRFIMEKIERNAITARFSSYVDPELVNYIQENLSQDTFNGREQEMTVVFTDLEGFTTLNERLGKDVVGILNEYVERMVPHIRSNRGLLDKFLGDGIMFEFNNLIPNPEHAMCAMRAVLQMQAEMKPFNDSLIERGLPTLKMRVGVNTGLMIMGDAGANKGKVRASNFTVLGDSVNLAARLEGANKPFGSLMMITETTFQQTRGRVAVRPLANLRVKGKENAVMVYEPLSLLADLTAEHRQLIDLSTTIFDLYKAGTFAVCIAACEAMDAALGHTKFADLYRHACERLLADGPTPEHWDGSISLSEK